MNLTKSTMAIPQLTRAFAAKKGTSKYGFADLAVGESLISTDFIDQKKAASKLTSAVASYRKRSQDKRTFSVRSFKTEGGSDAVGVFVSAAKEDVAEAAA